MATLQKIRNRGGVLVSIVIGLALVAFIVGDALSSGASLINRSRNKVGEVGGETIGIQEYQQKIMKNEDFIKSMNGLSALTDPGKYLESNCFRNHSEQGIRGIRFGR